LQYLFLATSDYVKQKKKKPKKKPKTKPTSDQARERPQMAGDKTSERAATVYWSFEDWPVFPVQSIIAAFAGNLSGFRFGFLKVKKQVL